MKSTKPTIVLFTGFLGSGKTSLILKTIGTLSRQQKNCAIIINEAGNVGIDQQEIHRLGCEVRELFGDCVCAAVKKGPLETTIKQILKKHENLDYIFLEPSGMADPESMYPAIRRCGYTAPEIQNIFIFDPFRVALYGRRLQGLFNHSLALAQAVVINKIDTVPEPALGAAVAMVRARREKLPIFLMNLKDGSDTSFESFIGKAG